jgi:Iron-sulfur cluster assembly protein
MTAAVLCAGDEILEALATVTDPELDEPITELGFVRSVFVDDHGVTVHDDHHDSEKINTGLAADAGYLGTFGDEAEEGLAELRKVFWRKAHTAAMERAIGSLLRRTPMEVDRVGRLVLRDLPEGKPKVALLRRRFAIGLSNCPNSRVLVDDDGHPIPLEAIPTRLRFAKSVRTSMEGNAHFCRGLLATRYAHDESAGAVPVVTDVRTHRRP